MLQYVIPQHLLSRITGRLADCRIGWIKNQLIKSFIKRFNVDMSEALQEDPTAYSNFNDFFTRELKQEARPIASSQDSIVSPVDAKIESFGEITAGQNFTVKGKPYRLVDLLGKEERAVAYEEGQYIVFY